MLASSYHPTLNTFPFPCVPTFSPPLAALLPTAPTRERNQDGAASAAAGDVADGVVVVEPSDGTGEGAAEEELSRAELSVLWWKVHHEKMLSLAPAVTPWLLDAQIERLCVGNAVREVIVDLPRMLLRCGGGRGVDRLLAHVANAVKANGADGTVLSWSALQPLVHAMAAQASAELRVLQRQALYVVLRAVAASALPLVDAPRSALLSTQCLEFAAKFLTWYKTELQARSRWDVQPTDAARLQPQWEALLVTEERLRQGLRAFDILLREGTFTPGELTQMQRCGSAFMHAWLQVAPVGGTLPPADPRKAAQNVVTTLRAQLDLVDDITAALLLDGNDRGVLQELKAAFDGTSVAGIACALRLSVVPAEAGANTPQLSEELVAAVPWLTNVCRLPLFQHLWGWFWGLRHEGGGIRARDRGDGMGIRERERADGRGGGKRRSTAKGKKRRHNQANSAATDISPILVGETDQTVAAIQTVHEQWDSFADALVNGTVTMDR